MRQYLSPGNPINFGAVMIDVAPIKETLIMRNPTRLATDTIKLPSNKEKAKADIVKALGLAEDVGRAVIIATVDALLAALEPVSPETIEREALAFGLSAREAKELASMKSNVRKYVELKAQRGYKPPTRRR